MALHQSIYAKGMIDLAVPECAGEVIAHFLKFDVPAAGIPLNDIVEFGVVPAGCRVVDVILHSDDLDDAAALVIKMGIMSGAWQEDDAARTVDGVFFTGDTSFQTGAVSRMSLASGFNLAKSDVDRSIGIEVTTAAGTPKAGTIRATVLLATE